jgi:hypothetical protein
MAMRGLTGVAGNYLERATPVLPDVLPSSRSHLSRGTLLALHF